MSLSRTGRIVILDENWGHATKDRVQAVLESVYSVLTDSILARNQVQRFSSVGAQENRQWTQVGHTMCTLVRAVNTGLNTRTSSVMSSVTS